jgi:Xaa-Pro aminopeptidase
MTPLARHRLAAAVMTCLLGTNLAWADDGVKPVSGAPVMLLGQPREDYAARRQELMKRIRQDLPERTASRSVIVLRGADEPENEGTFRQSNDFAYLTGVEAPSAVLVLWPAEEREALYLPPVPPHAGVFSEARPAPGPETAEAFGIQRVEPTSKLLADLFGTIADPLNSGGFGQRDRAVVYVRNPDARRAGDGPEPRLVRLLRDGAPTSEFRDVRPAIAAMRKVKSPAELDLLKRAVAITGEALDRVQRSIQPGIPEFRLKGQIVGAFVENGATTGFAPIVGSGPNGTIPHYFGMLRELEGSDLVVIDIGAEYRYYTADITRTYPSSGRFTPRQREVYQLVLDAQKAVENEMKPGQSKLSDMTRFTKEFFARSPLRALDESGQEQTMDHFFIHGLGHYLGMDVHDVGSYAEPVQVGEVFTIEPGLYIKSESIGVRIEDDYVMTEHGPEKLSKDIPSDPDEIERRIAGPRQPLDDPGGSSSE